MFNLLLQKSVEQNSKADSIIKSAKDAIDKTSAIKYNGDRNLFYYVDSFRFQEGEPTVNDINFNISQDADFVARRFGLFLKEKRFNDTFFVPWGFSFNFDGGDPVNAGLHGVDGGLVDGLFALSESYSLKNGTTKIRDFQNIPSPIKLSYSGNSEGYGNPSGLAFDVDWDLRRGSTLQCKITILSAVASSPVTGQPLSFEITGVLEGFKKTRSFR